MFGWGLGLVALVLGSDDFQERIDEQGFAHMAIIAGLGTWLGALRGRRFGTYCGATVIGNYRTTTISNGSFSAVSTPIFASK